MEPFDLREIKVLPLQSRQSLTKVEAITLDPTASPKEIPAAQLDVIRQCARKIAQAREQGKSVILIYGAHLIRNGASRILQQLIDKNYLTHLATNGAGTIHDWEYAYLGVSTEDVAANVHEGCFGTWDETGRHIHTALYAGTAQGLGYGAALGDYILQDGATISDPAALESEIFARPEAPETVARFELLSAIRRGELRPGRAKVEHPWKSFSLLAHARKRNVPLTVHPGIGYDIISNHPMFNGAVIGRAATIDFRLFCASVMGLDDGVVLSIGSAIMGPQVFEKSLSCVNNVRRQRGKEVVHGHTIYVVDLQDSGNWNWEKGEPPKDNPAYYLRFCKSYSRMGGKMQYLQCDNAAFVHHLYQQLIG